MSSRALLWGGMLAAACGGHTVTTPAPEHRLPAATRKGMLLLFARAAAMRLQALHDPTGPYQFD